MLSLPRRIGDLETPDTALIIQTTLPRRIGDLEN